LTSCIVELCYVIDSNWEQGGLTVGQSSLCDGRSGIYKRKKYESLEITVNINNFL
jgi:hypothetical protein